MVGLNLKERARSLKAADATVFATQFSNWAPLTARNESKAAVKFGFAPK